MGYGGIVRSVLEVITKSSVAPRSNSAWYTELSQFMNTLETHVEESRGIVNAGCRPGLPSLPCTSPRDRC